MPGTSENNTPAIYPPLVIENSPAMDSEEELRQLRTQLLEVKDQLERLNRTHEELITSSEEQMTALTSELENRHRAALKKMCAEHKEEIENRDAQILDLSQELARLKSEHSANLSAQQERSETLEASFQATLPETPFATRRAHSQATRESTKTISELKQLIEKYGNQVTALTNQNTTLQKQEKQRLEHIKKLQDKIDELLETQGIPADSPLKSSQNTSSLAEELAAKVNAPANPQDSQRTIRTRSKSLPPSPSKTHAAYFSTLHGSTTCTTKSAEKIAPENPAFNVNTSLVNVETLINHYLSAYKNYAPQHDRSFFFSHNKRGANHAQKVTDSIIQQLRTTFHYVKIEELSQLQPQKASQEIIETINDILKKALKKDKFSSTKPFSWRNHLKHLINYLEQNKPLGTNDKLPEIFEISQSINKPRVSQATLP